MLFYPVSSFQIQLFKIQLNLDLLEFSSCPSGAPEDSGGLGHGPGLLAVPGPAGLHARPHLP